MAAPAGRQVTLHASAFFLGELAIDVRIRPCDRFAACALNVHSEPFSVLHSGNALAWWNYSWAPSGGLGRRRDKSSGNREIAARRDGKRLRAKSFGGVRKLYRLEVGQGPQAIGDVVGEFRQADCDHRLQDVLVRITIGP